jgi:lipoprotein-anchoring transpeptidase ErfK/SrfK
MFRLKFIFTLVILFSVASVYAQCGDCYPAPQVERLLPNDHLLYSGAYYQVTRAVDVLDAPNGNVVMSRPEGLYFVSVLRFENGWAEINENQWIPADSVVPAPISRFGGVLLNDQPMQYRVGWVRRVSFPSTTSGASPVEDAEPLAQYQLVNIFSNETVDGAEWVEVGENQWLPREAVAIINPLERPAEIDTERWVAVDLAEQVLYAFDGERAVFATLVATGLNVTPTQEGLFHVYVRYRSTPMTTVDDSSPFFYYMEDVPWTMYFNGNQALHGAYWHDAFGYRRSHGCVNMSLTDSYWLYNFFAEQIDLTTEVVDWPAVYVYRHG